LKSYVKPIRSGPALSTTDSVARGCQFSVCTG
jgi:hypothetical protein